MAYASKLGRARVSATNPAAAGVCDRCGFVYNHADLSWQFDYRGPVLQNIRLLVCKNCMDDPQTQLKAIVLPADPVPIMQPRVQDYQTAETDYASVVTTTTDPTTGIPVLTSTEVTTADGSPVTKQPIGVPGDIDINAVMPLFESTHYRVQLDPLSVTANDTPIVTATFSSAHGLSTNDQIAVQGLSNAAACGAFSVTVISATTFTYQANVVIASGSLLTSDTLMVTALVGLPRGMTQIPQTGV